MAWSQKAREAAAIIRKARSQAKSNARGSAQYAAVMLGGSGTAWASKSSRDALARNIRYTRKTGNLIPSGFSAGHSGALSTVIRNYLKRGGKGRIV